MRFIDAWQPGRVRCALADAWGRTGTFEDKGPIFTTAWLDDPSAYPQPGALACRVVRRWRDAAGRGLVTIDVREPYDLESTDGQTCFGALPEQMTA